MKNLKEYLFLSGTVLLVAFIIFEFTDAKKNEIAELKTKTADQALHFSSTSNFNPPHEADIPQNQFGESVRKGLLIVTQTRQYAPNFVGNKLNCTSCHLNGGRKPFAAPWVGVWGVFPEYRARSGRVNTLQDRVNDCFERSMNGKRLPDSSDEMISVLAYMQWISTKIPTGVSVEGRGFKKLTALNKPDPIMGAKLFANKCSMCHGEDGQGKSTPDGRYLYPALWGQNSFNIGAGMARLNNAAAFIRANMPLGQEGTLTDDQAFDIAAFFIAQPRPDFARKSADWPKGEKPKDARY